MPDFKLEVGAKLPGQEVLNGLLDVVKTYRETMSDVNRNELDRIFIAQLRGWHNFWVSIGWPGEKV